MESVAVSATSGAADCGGVSPAVNFLDPRLPDEFWAQCAPCAVTGCWLWLGQTAGGYPIFGSKRRGQVLAKRFAYSKLIAEVLRRKRVRTACELDICCNPQHAVIVSDEWTRFKNRDRTRAHYEANKAAYKARAIDSHRRRRYGIDSADVERMLCEQDNSCAICTYRFGARRDGRVVRVCVDHDHVTGRVRSLLCDGCNVGLGSYQDRPDLLRAAADYLERHSAKAKP